jgi:hypothetical protein
MAIFLMAGTWMVRLSSRHLLVQQRLAMEAGYRPLPDAGLEDKLTSWPSTLAAGLFYAASLGIGLTILETAYIGILIRFFSSQTYSSTIFGFSAFFFLLYTGSLSSPVIWVSLALSLSLLAALILLHRAPREQKSRADSLFSLRCLLIPGTVAVLVIIGYLVGVRDFVAARDLLLLPHGLGRMLTDFYYDHTIMATRPLESAGQRAWLLAGAEPQDFSPKEWTQLQSLLLQQGIFLVSNPSPSQYIWYDIRIAKAEERIVISFVRGGPTYPLPLDGSSDSLSGVLNKLRQQSDPVRPLKRVLAICIGFVCPFFLLMLAARSISWGFSLVLHRVNHTALVLIWLVISITLIGVVIIGPGKPLPSDEGALDHFARKGDPFQRVRAARTLAAGTKKEDFLKVFLALAENSDFRVRIWAAQGLSHYSGRDVTHTLVKLSREANLTVITSSIFALSRQSDFSARETLKTLCKDHKRSYVRDAAFRALKKRGWLEKTMDKGAGVEGGFCP